MSLKSTLATLIEARRIVSLPESWTKGVNCRDKDGEPLALATSRRACRWCVVGAVYRAGAKATSGSVFDDVEAIRLLSKVIAPNGNPNESADLNTVASFNDAERTTHQDVIGLFNKAIALQQERIQRHYGLQAAMAHTNAMCLAS